MAFAFILPLRAVQAVFSLIVLGLTAYIVSAWYWSPHSVNFMLFCSVWTLLAVAYLVLAPTRFPRAAHKYAICAVESITMIFWFAAWVAVAALWGDLHLWRSWGPRNAGIAAIIFGAFIWLTFLATTIMSALHVYRTPRSTTSADPEMRAQGV
ncbi:membrane-associating domain-containing protein [Dendryphion nanum]|uniref:Membrane-associating domain-containing protein n=1 Tax=Dendryphion nanum TaxID=256645 RepID=A0A9P9DBF7_9PLEO|nr:membrane-associating domain-containing protein [Dendryphion nanum]